MPQNNRPASSAEEGAPILAIRKDAATPLADTDGDFIFLSTDANGNLRVAEAAGGAGSQTASSPDAATVGTSSAEVVAANANRTGLILVNTSANTISLGIGAAAVLNSGITLVASGGSFNMEGFDFSTSAVNAIASSASSNLSVQEFT